MAGFELPYPRNKGRLQPDPAHTNGDSASSSAEDPHSRVDGAPDLPSASPVSHNSFHSPEASDVEAVRPMEPTSSSNDGHSECVKVIEISDDRFSSDFEPMDPGFAAKGTIYQVQPDNGHLGGSVVIMLAKSKDSKLQCLRLCRHENKKGRRNEAMFWRRHSYVFDPEQSTTSSFADSIGARRCPSIRVVLHEGVELLPKCFVNYEHTWTVGGPGAKLKEIGYLAEGEMDHVLDSYHKTLAKMYNWPSSEAAA